MAGTLINEVIYPFTATLSDTGTHIRCFTVPYTSCATLDPIYYSDTCWNDEVCGDEIQYCNPVVNGDLLYFQMRFPDNISPDIKNPTSGWNSSIYVKGEVYASDGTLLGSVIPYASEYMVSHTQTIDVSKKGFNSTVAGGSFQNIIINTSAINEDCFYFAFYYKVDASTWSDPLYTEQFCKVHCEAKTVLLQTQIKGFDCYNVFYGNGTELPYYGSSFFDHIGRLRIAGEITLEGSEIIKTQDFNRNVTENTTNELYTVRTMLVPPYVAKKTVGQLLAGQRVLVDGNEFDLRTPPQKNNDDNRMWLMDIELSSECEIDFLC